MLSFVESLVVFYLLFCDARMNFAGPYDIGIYGAVNNWFVARRAQAASIATLAQMLGLVAMPLIAHAAILADGWRNGWLAVGATVLIVGFRSEEHTSELQSLMRISYAVFCLKT